MQPLCLLTPDMQNRRIIDGAFRSANAAPVPRLETNSVINLCANVRLMGLTSIIPEYFLQVLGPIADVRGGAAHGAGGRTPRRPHRRRSRSCLAVSRRGIRVRAGDRAVWPGVQCSGAAVVSGNAILAYFLLGSSAGLT